MTSERKGTIERNKTELTGIIGREAMDLLQDVVGEQKWRRYRDIYDQACRLDIETDYPLQLDFELNASCNLKCPMCPLSTESNAGKGKESWFSFDTYRKIIDEGVGRGLLAVRFNYLNEPLIRDDLPRFIEYAKTKGICDTYLSTNGMLLTEQMSLALIDAGLARIQISLDAYTPETYDKIRIGGRLTRVIDNIETLIACKKKLQSVTPLIRVNFVRTELNEHELEDFVAFWKNKVDMIGVQEMVKPPESARKLQSKTTEDKATSGFKCSSPFKLMVINCEGDILACCSFYGEKLKVGHIATDSIGDVWNGEKMKKLRLLHKEGRFAQNPVCKTCVYSSVEDV